MGQLIWTEAVRVQLVEAVITVEREMMVAEATRPGQQMGRAQKWSAIARLLPPDFRTESWNNSRQSFNFPKCYSIFYTLAKGYRNKVAGKNDPWNLTEPVCRLFKKREELLLERGSPLVVHRLRPGSTKRINKTITLGPNVQPLLKDVANSSDGQSLSVPEGNDACNFEHTPDEGTLIDLGKHKGNAKMEWTETACLLVIEAVIQVEEEIRNGWLKPLRSTTGRASGKWERIDALLPPVVCPRGRERNLANGTYSKYRCSRFFNLLLSRYRRCMRRKGGKGRTGLEDPKNFMLTKPVRDLLVKLLNARTSSRHQNSLQSAESPGRAIAKVNSFSKDTSRNSDINQEVELSSDGESLGKGAGSSFLSDYTKHSESSRFESVFKDPDNICEPSAEAEVRARAPCRTPEMDVISPPKPPSESLRASGSVGKNTDSMTEERDAIFDGLNLEFSWLSSWVQSQSVPMGIQIMDVINNSASRADKRHKLNCGCSSTEPFDNLIHESLSRLMDFQIRAAFQKVRVRFAEELKSTCAELSRDLQQRSELLRSTPTRSPDVSRKRI